VSIATNAAEQPMPGPAAEHPNAAAPGHRAVAIWLLCCCAMIFAMVVIGGITRLTLSGLSITEWEPVIGAVPPLSPEAWAGEFEKYRRTTQYRLINYGMGLDAFKSIYLWEYVHRLWGRLIGVAFGHEDEMAPAKLVGDAGKGAPIKLVGGIFEGKLVDQAFITALAKLPGKKELLAQLVRVLQGPTASFVRVLNARREKMEQPA